MGKSESKEKILLAWSGGKDSARTLFDLLQSDRYSLAALLVTITKEYERVSMHGVRCELIQAQATTIGLPLEKVYITKNASNEEYEEQMKNVLLRYKTKGVTAVAFGDIFLEDLKKYREENLHRIGMNAIFPLWGKNTSELAHSFVELGFKAIITCVDSEKLYGSFVGREYDEKFLADLPKGVDSCGENGEFHSFVYDGPVFSKKVRFKKGEVVLRDDRFWYCDLIPCEL